MRIRADTTSLFNCKKSEIRRYKIKYFKKGLSNNCKYIKKIVGKYELPFFGSKPGGFEKASANEIWAKLDLEKKALDIGSNALEIISIDEAFWSGDVEIKAKAYKCFGDDTI